jgi:hypothetical protein
MPSILWIVLICLLAAFLFSKAAGCAPISPLKNGEDDETTDIFDALAKSDKLNTARCVKTILPRTFAWAKAMLKAFFIELASVLGEQHALTNKY